MIIAQHLEGHSWSPAKPWPEKTMVQWGSKGVVLRQQNSYTTAFFEAFPDNIQKASSFIRGEGATLEEAEEDAFSKFQRNVSCHHKIGRRGYTNGGGLCIKCGAFFSKAFHPITTLGEWKKPLSASDLEIAKLGALGYREGKYKRLNKHHRAIYLRLKVEGVDLPPFLSSTYTQQERENYEQQCYWAVTVYILNNLDKFEEWTFNRKKDLSGVFSNLSLHSLLLGVLHIPMLDDGRKARIERCIEELGGRSQQNKVE